MGYKISEHEAEKRAYAERQAAVAWERKLAAQEAAEAARDRRELEKTLAGIKSAAESEVARERRDREKTLESIKVAGERENAAEEVRLRKEIDRAMADAISALQAREREQLGAPRTVRTGATHDLDRALPVFHFQTSMAGAGLDPKLGGNAAGDGPLVYLRAGGGVPDSMTATAVLISKRPEVRHSAAHARWHREVLAPALADVRQRYAVLAKLRDDDWWAGVCEAAGLADSTTRTDTHRGTDQSITQRVSVSNIPSLTGVRIGPEGLELTYRHRVSDSPERWSRALHILRTAFTAAGVDAAQMTVTTTATGDMRIDFNDAPNTFPPAVAPEPPARPVRDRADAIARYRDAAWVLGVDARGTELRYGMEKIPHVLVAGGTGGGKSVWARTTIEALRAGFGFTCFVASGKISDFAALEGQPGIAMVAGDAAQTAVMVRRVRVEMDRRIAAAADAKRSGDTDAFAFPPVLLLLDEWGATAMEMERRYGKSAGAFAADIDLILRLGREARVHCVLLSQTIRKTGPGAVPGSWQENLGLTVSLGEPSSITLMSDAFTEESRPRASKIGSRLKGKQGRGLTSERESGRVVEFQSYYGWSPGTTSLDPKADAKVRPPTPEVRSIWERWVPISDAVPWIMPRVGIKCDGPDWADGDDLDVVADTPTVVLTDASGRVKPGYEQYDPTSRSWLGRPDPTAAQGDHEDLEFAEDAPTAQTRPEAVSPPPPAEPATDDGGNRRYSTPETPDTADPVREWAIANGLISEDHPEHPGNSGAGSSTSGIPDDTADDTPDTDSAVPADEPTKTWNPEEDDGEW